MMSTAAQTITNANRVPMFVRCKSASIGRNAVMAATKTPIRIVLIQGVRNLGWTLAKIPRGTSPSRAMARKTRGALSIITSNTDVMPATPARAMMNSAQPLSTLLKASDTPASLLICW
jgi:hypothetical protein